MPINDDEARYLLDRVKSALEDSADPMNPAADHYLHQGTAGGISFALDYCGPEWAKKECMQIWEAMQKR